MMEGPKRFPELHVRDLEGEDYDIPHGLPGGPHLLVVAFQRWQQMLVDHWMPKLRAVAERHPGTEVWEVPSLSKAYRLFRAGIDGGMRAEIHDETSRRHTLTAYTDLSALARALDIPSFDTIHVFLVDSSGVILWRASGEPDPAALEALERAMPQS